MSLTNLPDAFADAGGLVNGKETFPMTTHKSNDLGQLEQDQIQEREEYDRAENALSVRIAELEHWRNMIRDIRAHRGL